MAESKAPSDPDPIGQWLTYWFSRPIGKLVLTVLLGVLLAGCWWLDERARARGTRSLFAPSREEFWLALQFGAVIGLAAFLADVLQNVARGFTRWLVGNQAHERLRRKRLWTAVDGAYEGFWGVLFLVPLGGFGLWFCLQGCLPLVPWAAPLAVIIPGMLLMELIFGAAPWDAQPQAAPAEN